MFYFHAVLHKVQEVFPSLDLFTKISFVLKLHHFSWRPITFITIGPVTCIANVSGVSRL